MEMKAEHTSGPWNTHGGNIVQDSIGQDIAKCWMVNGAKECANARLIAAAPELLDALRGALFFVPLGTLARERADAAIDRATGN